MLLILFYLINSDKNIYLKFFNVNLLSCRFLSTETVTGILHLYFVYPHLIGSKRNGNMEKYPTHASINTLHNSVFKQFTFHIR